MSREPLESRPEGGKDSPATLPEELKPWYYQYWFLYPTIIFWPLWPALIIRSPWHNGLVSGAIAWAMLIVGGYWVYQRLQMGGTVVTSTLIIIVPGLILTLVTQTHWLLNRRRIREASGRVGLDAPKESAVAAPEKSSGPARRRANRRPARRRR